MRVDDICQAHRCAGGIQVYADHTVGSRAEESLGALSGFALRRRAPHRAGRRDSSPCTKGQRQLTTYASASPVGTLVRELRAFHVMLRSGVTSDTRPSLKEITHRAIAEAERQAIRLALQATGGNKSEAARLLRVDYKTLHLKMKRYGIEAREFRTT